MCQKSPGGLVKEQILIQDIQDGIRIPGDISAAVLFHGLGRHQSTQKNRKSSM